ncbi:MAG: nucleoside deaminase [Candidatus Pacearchaeota archaeon]
MSQIKQAIFEAKKGIKKKHGGPFGCIIVKDNKIISSAHNTVLKDKDPTSHAEINAIRKACKKLKTLDLSLCELYTTTYPCPMCLGAILWSRIKKIYYLTDSEDVKKIGFDDLKFYKFIQGKNKHLLKIEKINSLENKDFNYFLKNYKEKTY